MEFNGAMNLVFKLLLPVMRTMNFVLLPKMLCSAGGSYLKENTIISPSSARNAQRINVTFSA